MATVREILQVIKETSNEEGSTVILKSTCDQKLLVDVCKKDQKSIEIIEYLSDSGNYTIAEVLSIIQDAYWWLQTLAILYDAGRVDSSDEYEGGFENDRAQM